MSLPWMPLYVADYLAKTSHLNAAESGAYMHLIMHYWQNGSLPNDDARLARIAKMTPEEWSAARPVLREFFGENWTHERIDDELAEAEKKHSRRVASGKLGGRPKQTESNAKAMLKQCSTQPQPQLPRDDDDDERAFELAVEIGRLCGHPTPDDWPPRFCGAPHRIRSWLSQGWKPEIILSGVKEALARKRDGPPDSVNYFEKPIARAHAVAEAPLPKVVVNNEVIHATVKRNSLLAAIDRLEQAAGGGGDGGPSAAVLSLPKG